MTNNIAQLLLSLDPSDIDFAVEVLSKNLVYSISQKEPLKFDPNLDCWILSDVRLDKLLNSFKDLVDVLENVEGVLL